MKPYLTTIIIGSICACLLGVSAAKEENHWKPGSEIQIGAIEKMLVSLKDKEPSTLLQPTMLAYKAALFLASGSTDTPVHGKLQNLSAKFSGGEEQFNRVDVTVEFMGYADDSLSGERFIFQLNANQAGVWKVTKIERAAYGRGDHQ
jgi:hypothetical protein